LPLLTGLHTYSAHAYMALDPHTRRNLELTRTSRAGDSRHSLLAVLDATRTPMGGRLLRRFLSQPLLDVDQIRQRQANVAALVEDRTLRGSLAAALDGMADLERATSRLRQGVASPRELAALRSGLTGVGALMSILRGAPRPLRTLGE